MGASFIILIVSVFAGSLGAILGLGGGLIIIPLLTLGFGINIRYAIGASIVSVIATSSGAAASYIKDHITNLRLAILLEIATSVGGFAGSLLALSLHTKWLFILFALIMAHSAIMTWKRGRDSDSDLDSSDAGEHPWAKRLQLSSEYFDPKLQKPIRYAVEKVPLGLIYMLFAGIFSGLLGIGSGILKVLAMDTAMKLPIKVSSATSNFMIGVTAAASAGVYFMHGQIIPSLAAPIAIGVIFGAWVGAKLMPHLPAKKIRAAFVIVLLLVSAQMAWRGFTSE